MDGYVSISRELLNCEWYTDVPTFKLYIHLILIANYTDAYWKGEIIKRGQRITGRKQLAYETGLTEQQVRTSLKKLESTNKITTKSTNKNTLVTVENYDFITSLNKKSTNNLTNNQPTNNQQITTNNKDNKEKREISISNNSINTQTKSNRFVKPTLDEITQYCNERDNTIDPNKFLNYYESNGWMVGRSKMKDWKAAIRTWEMNDSKISKPEKKKTMIVSNNF